MMPKNQAFYRFFGRTPAITDNTVSHTRQIQHKQHWLFISPCTDPTERKLHANTPTSHQPTQHTHAPQFISPKFRSERGLGPTGASGHKGPRAKKGPRAERGLGPVTYAQHRGLGPTGASGQITYVLHETKYRPYNSSKERARGGLETLS